MTGCISELLQQSHQYAEDTLSLQAAASIMPPEITRLGSEVSEITAEGYPNSRYHSGTRFVDQVEQLCIGYAKTAFNAQYANVQPLSCSMANIAVMMALLSPGDRILGLDITHGGHLSHGAHANLSGKLFEVSRYYVNAGLIDLDLIRKIAIRDQPKLIIAGASSYPRTIDFEGFRAIADEVGALLLADISHIAGLVATGEIPSPINCAHITTTSTYKQLYGPRGGLIMSGRDAEMKITRAGTSLSSVLQAAVFPSFQGTPDFGQIAMKAKALETATSPRFRARMKRVVQLSKSLATSLVAQGFQVVTGGTDTHMVVVDLSELNVSGVQLEVALESGGIIANRNLVPDDKRNAKNTSGIRFGTNIAAYRHLTDEVMNEVTMLIGDAIRQLDHGAGRFDYQAMSTKVKTICRDFPLRACDDLSA